ncbi:MAG: FAD-binding oxidoreductase [Bacteroidia bacterium]
MDQKNTIQEIILEISAALPDLELISTSSEMEDYGSDYTEDLFFPPAIVCFPSSVEQIAILVKICNSKCFPIYTRGAGTGLSGACLPVRNGLVLSTKKLNRIMDIDTKNLTVTVESGVINAKIKEAVEAKGLYYPPDPASQGSCSIGGNLAHGAGGPRAVKYGITRDYVLNLEVVLPTGEIIWTGANTLKNSTGFSLTHLMVGSEGMLGIITKAVLKLIPKPTQELLLLAAFSDLEDCASAVNAVLLSKFKPCAIELMEKSGIEISMNATQTPFPIHENAEAYLLFAFDGFEGDDLFEQAEGIFEILDSFKALEILPSPNSDVAAQWWKVRRSIGETVKQISPYKEEDTVVPRSEMPLLLRKVKEIGERYGFQSVCYGHAGDGNLHVNILRNNLTDEQWQIEIPKAITEIFEHCKKVGGTISGEHGVGLVQKDYLPIVFGESHFRLMHGIKNTFDPKNILNPGKWLD